MRRMAVGDAGGWRGGGLSGWSCCFSLVNNTERASTTLPPHHPSSQDKWCCVNVIRQEASYCPSYPICSPGQIISHCRAFTGSVVQPPRETAGQPASRPVGCLAPFGSTKNFLPSPPTTPGTTPTNTPRLESGERSNGRYRHTLFHIVLKQTATPVVPGHLHTEPLTSPADTGPLQGSDWTACRAAQSTCLVCSIM